LKSLSIAKQPMASGFTSNNQLADFPDLVPVPEKNY
jgi:hypothetical protein